ncbi:DNA recombination protein RmuC [Sulfurimonas sp.]
MELYGLIALSLIILFLFYLYLKVREQNIALHQNNGEMQELYKTLINEKNDLQLKYAVLNTKYESEIESSSEKIQILNNAKEELSLEFKELSNRIFEDKAKQFGASNKEQLNLLLQPFREQISNFSKESREQFEVELKERHLLKNELLTLKKMNEQLSMEATNLTNALKYENKTQGNWGEIILENILEQSGLRKGVEYILQSTLKSGEGKIFRPDVIIHMPQNRDIIVDSKVSLVAYERYVNCDEKEEKLEALKAHIKSVTHHIKDLSEKKYEKLEGVNSLDFVLLFMPIEGAFSLVLEHDNEFFKNAYKHNILLVSPSTLLVTLRTIEHIWRTQRQEEYAKKIVKEAENMYDKLVLFVDEMQNIGQSLQKAQCSYDTAMSRLSSGKGNLIKRAQEMKSLGLKPNKELSLKSEND